MVVRGRGIPFIAFAPARPPASRLPPPEYAAIGITWGPLTTAIIQASGLSRLAGAQPPVVTTEPRTDAASIGAAKVRRRTWSTGSASPPQLGRVIVSV